MQLIDHTLLAMKQRWQESGVQKSQLAKLAGLHFNTLRNFGTSQFRPSISTIRALQMALFPELRTAVKAAPVRERRRRDITAAAKTHAKKTRGSH